MMSGMTESQKFIHVSKYSRWVEAENRRELSWKETADRYLSFMKGKFGTVVPKKVWQQAEHHLYSLGVVPSMRAVATAGEALESNNILLYNCTFTPFQDLRAVWELFYILMCGTGVGFSVENHWIKQMPAVKRWNGDGAGVWVVEDSSEGWAKSLEAGLEAWFDGKDIEFDYSKIRPRGARLRTKGGRASGPEPLMRLHAFCREQISRAQGRQLTSVEWLDIGNVIADVVIVGGVRRSSEICFSDLDDVSMREAKDWSKGIPGYRANSNNSAVYFTKPDAATFLREWGHLVESCAGERGIFNLHAAKQTIPERRTFSWEMRTNPCGEVLLKPFQFCVSYNTPLITPDALVTIGESVDKEIEVWNGLGWRRVTPRKTGSGRKLYRVKLSDGSFLDCTDNHGFSVKTRFQKTFSRVEAKDLMGYSKYPLQLEPTVITFGGGRKIENAYTLGFVVGDGHVVYGEKDTHQDHVYCILYGDKMECPVEGGRGRVSVKTGYNVPSVTVDCTQVLHGMADTVSELKSNPDALNELFSWSRESVLNFVAGLADSDGSETTTGGIRVYISQEARARKLQLLLSKSGIRSSVNLMSKKGETTNCGTRNEDIWYLQITDCSNIPCHRLDTSQGHAAKLKGKYQNVVSVTELPGVHDTYCFEEPERHMAVFGNVLTYQCNLSEVIVRANDDFDKLVEKVSVAVWFGAMQASLTKFPLLRKEFEKNCKEEALLGVSLTGQMDNSKLMTPEKLAILKAFAIKTAKKASSTLGINMAAAVTCGKPSGTVSQLTNAASGAHPTFADYYIRRYRLNSTDPCFRLMKAQGIKFSPENDQGPESVVEKRKAMVAKGHSEASAKKLVPDWDESQVRTWVCEFPMAAAKGAITRSKVSALDQLEWYLKVQKNWCEHNQSITVYVRDEEWLKVGAWIYDHFDEIVGVTCLPYSGGSYKQMPYEEITKERYEEMLKKFPKIDWSVLPQFEHDDQTTGAQLLSCTAGNCEV